MPRRHQGLPTATSVRFSKAAILQDLATLDQSAGAKARVLNTLEPRFRQRVAQFNGAAVVANDSFKDFLDEPLCAHDSRGRERPLASQPG